MNLKPYNRVAAMSGATVVRRDGLPVVEIFFSNFIKDILYTYKSNERYFSTSVNEDGIYFTDYKESPNDLLMAPKTKKFWIGITKNIHNINESSYLTTDAYHNKEMIIGKYQEFAKDFKLIEIEIEIEE